MFRAPARIGPQDRPLVGRREVNRTMVSTRAMIGACLGMTLAALAADGARAEPPIRGPQDAACRNEARGRVFSAPNPRGLEPEALGRQIYHACMRRAKHRR